MTSFLRPIKLIEIHRGDDAPQHGCLHRKYVSYESIREWIRDPPYLSFIEGYKLEIGEITCQNEGNEAPPIHVHQTNGSFSGRISCEL